MHSTAPAASELIHNLLCDCRVCVCRTTVRYVRSLLLQPYSDRSRVVVVAIDAARRESAPPPPTQSEPGRTNHSVTDSPQSGGTLLTAHCSLWVTAFD